MTELLQLRLGWNAWATAPIGILAGALVGWAIGAMVFRARLRGSYFALVTLAFAEVLRILANALDFTRSIVDMYLPRKRLDVGTWGIMGIGRPKDNPSSKHF